MNSEGACRATAGIVSGNAPLSFWQIGPINLIYHHFPSSFNKFLWAFPPLMTAENALRRELAVVTAASRLASPLFSRSGYTSHASTSTLLFFHKCSHKRPNHMSRSIILRVVRVPLQTYASFLRRCYCKRQFLFICDSFKVGEILLVMNDKRSRGRGDDKTWVLLASLLEQNFWMQEQNNCSTIAKQHPPNIRVTANEYQGTLWMVNIAGSWLYTPLSLKNTKSIDILFHLIGWEKNIQVCF